MSERWRFIADGPADGAFNMAVDEALASSSLSGAPCTLRVYTFSPPCVTIGRFQKLEGFIDLAECSKLGIGVSRRPTGGLAILHDHDVTYSFTSPLEALDARGRDECFAFIARGIVAAMALLGIEARLSSRQETPRGPGWCFEQEFGIDIEWEGRKLCGSAQRRGSGTLLQHGSVFLEDNSETAARLTASTERGSRALVSLREAGGRELDAEEVTEAFRRGFASAHGVELVKGSLTAEELSTARSLLDEKYSRSSWITGDSATGVYDIIGP